MGTIHEDGPENGANKHWLRPRNFLALGTAAIIGTFQAFSAQSGEHIIHLPTSPLRTEQTDTNLDVLQWNMYDEVLEHTSDLARLSTQNETDVMLLQEVNSEDAARLAKRFPSWYTTHVIGERVLQEGHNGGFGNVIMTRQKPEDTRTMSIEADSFIAKAGRTLAGLGNDVAHADTSGTRTSEGLQEQRAIVAQTVKVGQHDVRIGTSHIAGAEHLNPKQMSKIENFLRSDQDDGRPMVFGADLNLTTGKVRKRVEDDGFTVPYDGPTHVYAKVPIDHMMYRGEGKIKLSRMKVERRFKTDHYPLIARFTTRVTLGERASSR